MATQTKTERIYHPRSEQLTSNGVTFPASVGGGINFVATNSVDRGESPKNWKALIASGGNATSSLIGSEETYDFRAGLVRWEQRSRSTGVVVLGYTASGWLTEIGRCTEDFNLAETSANNLALKRYYDHVNAINSKFQGLVFSGELRESLNMIRRPGHALRRGVSDYLRRIKRSSGKYTRPKKRLRFVRDTWLEYSFGWRPLINDIDKAITAFYLSDAVKPIFEMVKGTGKQESLRSLGGSSGTYGPASWFWYQKFVEEVHVKYFGIQHSEGRGVANSHHYGFHPAEFVPTLWELIPYSFLVDYFSNIGEILSSWSYRFLLNGWTAKTTRRELLKEASQAGAQTGSVQDATHVYNYGGDPGYAKSTKKLVVRSPSVDPGVPSLELQVPGRWQQWVNILALTNQLSSTRATVNKFDPLTRVIPT